MGIFSWFPFVLDDFRVTFHLLAGSARSISCSLIFFLICLSFCFLQDQYDIIEKHTQSGLELVEKYVKFVKERTEIEQNYAKQLRQASIISIVILLVFLRCLPHILNCGCLLLFAWLKCLCGLVMSLGQNRTCLWRTHSCCVFAPACSPSSSMMALTLQAHIWWSAELSWRGEEVGADWHMTDRECERRKHILVFSSFLFQARTFLSKYLLLQPLFMSTIVINARSLFTGTFLRSITLNGAAKMSQSAGEDL